MCAVICFVTRTTVFCCRNPYKNPVHLVAQENGTTAGDHWNQQILRKERSNTKEPKRHRLMDLLSKVRNQVTLPFKTM